MQLQRDVFETRSDLQHAQLNLKRLAPLSQQRPVSDSEPEQAGFVEQRARERLQLLAEQLPVGRRNCELTIQRLLAAREAAVECHCEELSAEDCCTSRS